MRSALEHRYPPYVGSDPYLHLCFSDRDTDAVRPLVALLYERGVRLWYATGKSARTDVLALRNERADHAALTVLYLSEAARADTDVKDVVLYCQEQGLPMACIDADEGDHGLSVGLTRAVPHVPAWQMSSAEEVEEALVHVDGFVQELVGLRPEPYQDPLKKLALALAALALTALLAGLGCAWYTGLLAPASHHPGDTAVLASADLLAAARRAQGGGAVTDESLLHITVLRLHEVPGSLDDLAPFTALRCVELPQNLASEAKLLLDGPYDVALVEGACHG